MAFFIALKTSEFTALYGLSRKKQKKILTNMKKMIK